MPRQGGRQKEIVGRVMHEYKHGELESGSGRKVRNPRQAVAIGLSEAGASRKKSPAQNTRSRRRTEDKERKGQTARQQKEGRAAPKSRKAAPKSSRARSARSASRTPARGRSARSEPTRAELYAETKRRGMHGCSRLSKADLARALRRR